MIFLNAGLAAPLGAVVAWWLRKWIWIQKVSSSSPQAAKVPLSMASHTAPQVLKLPSADFGGGLKSSGHISLCAVSQ